MKTGKKISLIYSAITISIVMVVGVVFWLFASNLTDRLYYRYLEEKARLIGMERFEKDELPAKEYSHVVEEREQAIPTDRHVIIDIGKPTAGRDLGQYLTTQQAKQLLHHRPIRFRQGEEVGVGIPYVDNEGTFAILLYSHNSYGTHLSHIIGWALLAVMALTTLALWLFSRLYAIRMVNRIDRDYQTEKLFVNNASHEINNPLTAIQGECEIALMRERSREEYLSSLQRIATETNRVIRIMRQLLQFSHTRSTKLNAEELDRISMAALLQPLCEDTVRLVVSDDFAIMAKEDLMTIAMRNLVSNALKYSDGKPVTVTIAKPFVRIEDHGIGIPVQDLKHIFEPFYRASNATAISGHGIGLALAREILDKFHATVSVVSHPGESTCFTIRFHIKAF